MRCLSYVVLDVLRQRADDREVIDAPERRHDPVGDLVGGARVVLRSLNAQVNKDLAGHVASSVGVSPDSAKPAARVKAAA